LLAASSREEPALIKDHPPLLDGRVVRGKERLTKSADLVTKIAFPARDFSSDCDLKDRMKTCVMQ
jgi:hypothetical protein